VLATIHPDWTGSPQHFAAGLILTAVIALGLRRFVAWKGWQVAADTSSVPLSLRSRSRSFLRGVIDAEGVRGVIPRVSRHASRDKRCEARRAVAPGLASVVV
jgi:hypothetical protein